LIITRVADGAIAETLSAHGDFSSATKLTTWLASAMSLRAGSGSCFASAWSDLKSSMSRNSVPSRSWASCPLSEGATYRTRLWAMVRASISAMGQDIRKSPRAAW
jgi:hypothetical protein